MSIIVICLLTYLVIGLTVAMVSLAVYFSEARKNRVLDTVMGMLAITLAWPALMYLSYPSK